MKATVTLLGPSLSLEAAMATRHLRLIAPVVLLLSLQSPAQTAELDAAAPRRWESATIDERGTELLVRFDRPISHERSWLFLLRNGDVVETIHPRLQAAPNVLFARIRTPPTGDYVVRWIVCPEGSNDRYDGEFPFTVGREAASTAEGHR
jgi:hypothetical protein